MSDTSSNRTRTISWEDPRAAAEAGRGLSGLEYLQKMIAGEIPRPPISALMNFGLTELSEGHAVFTVESIDGNVCANVAGADDGDFDVLAPHLRAQAVKETVQRVFGSRVSRPERRADVPDEAADDNQMPRSPFEH